MFQTGDVVYGEGKLRDLGMVFKPSFKCLKNKKVFFCPAFLKLETLLYQSIYGKIFLLPVPNRACSKMKRHNGGLVLKNLIYIF